jgi:hypothetical protein
MRGRRPALRMRAKRQPPINKNQNLWYRHFLMSEFSISPDNHAPAAPTPGVVARAPMATPGSHLS